MAYYALIAARSGWTPMMFMTRVRLYASTCMAISVATFGRRFIRKCVAPIRILSVPKGCSTVSRRTNILSPDGRTFVVAAWEFAAFIAISLVFLLIGLRVASIPFPGLGATALSVAIAMRWNFQRDNIDVGMTNGGERL